MTEPTQNEIDDVLNQCAQAADEGSSKFPGMNYEQGVDYAIRWMQGEGQNPMED